MAVTAVEPTKLSQKTEPQQTLASEDLGLNFFHRATIPGTSSKANIDISFEQDKPLETSGDINFWEKGYELDADDTPATRIIRISVRNVDGRKIGGIKLESPNDAATIRLIDSIQRLTTKTIRRVASDRKATFISPSSLSNLLQMAEQTDTKISSREFGHTPAEIRRHYGNRVTRRSSSPEKVSSEVKEQTFLISTKNEEAREVQKEELMEKRFKDVIPWHDIEAASPQQLQELARDYGIPDRVCDAILYNTPCEIAVSFGDALYIRAYEFSQQSDPLLIERKAVHFIIRKEGILTFHSCPIEALEQEKEDIRGNKVLPDSTDSLGIFKHIFGRVANVNKDLSYEFSRQAQKIREEEDEGKLAKSIRKLKNLSANLAEMKLNLKRMASIPSTILENPLPRYEADRIQQVSDQVDRRIVGLNTDLAESLETLNNLSDEHERWSKEPGNREERNIGRDVARVTLLLGTGAFLSVASGLLDLASIGGKLPDLLEYKILAASALAGIALIAFGGRDLLSRSWRRSQ